MPGTKHLVPHQATGMQQADGISPERMRRVLGRFGEPLGDLCGGNRIGIPRLRKDPDASVLGDWDSAPPFTKVPGKPIGYQAMMYVAAIKQRDQDVYIQ